MIGTVLDGRYRILSLLGRGGMGEVYLAEHLALGRREALEILHPSLSAEPQLAKGLRREARTTRRLQHANIAGIYDFGQLFDGRFYLTMEYVDGPRLDELLRRGGPLPIPRMVRIVAQLAEAVDHAHSHGVIHGDLQPKNLALVEQPGRADVLKVLDLGVAEIVAPEVRERIAASRKGELHGNPGYMSPEQFEGERADPRSDLYAIGCIAFELLVGETPFMGRTMQLVHAHCTKAPDRPSARRADAAIPRLLDELVLRCLEKDPDRRFQTGREILAALAKLPGYGSYRGGAAKPSELPFEIAHDTDFARPKMPAPPPSEPDDSEARSLLTATLRQLAETLIDLGSNDLQLVHDVSMLDELEDELERNQLERSRVEARTRQVEQSAREREGALRFALDSLRPARQPGNDAERQMLELEHHLTETLRERDAQLSRLTERAIKLASQKGRIDDRLRAATLSLERTVVELAAAHAQNGAVQVGLARLPLLRTTAPRLDGRKQ